jgi:hypothetical protein
MAHAVDVQLVDQNLGGGAHIVLGAHGRLLGVPALFILRQVRDTVRPVHYLEQN